MKLKWQLCPEQINKREAESPAYQYVIVLRSDGQADLSVRHQGERASARPIKFFSYCNHQAAVNGAQRFEDKHGYAEPEQRTPAAVAPILPGLHALVRPVIDNAAESARTAANITKGNATDAWAVDIYDEYAELCASVLCCVEYDCYNRTEPGAQQCDEHRVNSETKED